MTMTVAELPATTEERKPVLWTCRVRGCKWKVHTPDAIVRTSWRWTKPTISNPQRKPRAKTVVLYPPRPRCPEHDLWADGGEIKGTYDPTVKCGPACTGAIGRTCRCACGGANHATG
jgi:hypothetical protein